MIKKTTHRFVSTQKDHMLHIFITQMVWFGFMVLNATFNNISVILWRSVLWVEETGGPGENHRPVASH
jgi:hypothetical protein